MRLYYDRVKRRFVTRSGYEAPLSAADLKVGSEEPLEILFSDDSVATDLEAGAQVRFGLKKQGEYDGILMALAETGDFTKVAGETGLYSAVLNLNVQAIKDALNAGDGNASNDKTFFEAMGQLDYRASAGVGWTKSPTLKIIVHNSVLNDTDGMEENPMPPYPLAQEVTDAVGAARGWKKQDVFFGARVLVPGDLGTLFNAVAGGSVTVFNPFGENGRIGINVLTGTLTINHVAGVGINTDGNGPYLGEALPPGFYVLHAVSNTWTVVGYMLSRKMGQADLDAAVAALVDSSPGALDTLNELAAALGDDPDFATTVTNALASKANRITTVNELTTARVLVAGDAGKWIRCDNAGDITITVNNGVFSEGDTVFFEQAGAGQIVFDGSATMEKSDDHLLKTAGQHAVMGIRFSSAPEATAFGEMELV